ncbi:hypothetical protein CV014_20010 [Nostoc sp. CMAA1605]|nr:hypothetical protein [Nostoc sp. CMAA1605]
MLCWSVEKQGSRGAEKRFLQFSPLLATTQSLRGEALGTRYGVLFALVLAMKLRETLLKIVS